MVSSLYRHLSLPKSCAQPVVLIMDWHNSHIKRLDLINTARENNVILVSLPSHCTHKLQSLDISFFKSMNTFYNQEVQAWLRQHPGRVVTEFQIAELFSNGYNKAACQQNAVSGFCKAGIVPFRRDLFSDADFAGFEMTNKPLPAYSTANEFVAADLYTSYIWHHAYVFITCYFVWSVACPHNNKRC